MAWVQDRWEIGPRALGNRSLLAEPFDARTRDALNKIKVRETYRPIAPVCRVEDADRLYTGGGFEDPYMLYFRRARSAELGAVTHVDGSARVQTVSRQTNAGLHDLLCAFADAPGRGRPVQHVPQLQGPRVHQPHVAPDGVLRAARRLGHGRRRNLVSLHP